MKQIILVRTDLNFGNKGKAIAQGCHATMAFLIERYIKGDRSAVKLVEDWWRTGQTKIVVRVENEKDLLFLLEEARKLKLYAYHITDAGRTVFKEPTVTCGAIGPGPDELVDRITGEAGPLGKLKTL